MHSNTVLKPSSSNMTQKFRYILLDLCKFSDFGKKFFLKKIILKTKSKKNLKKNWLCIFRQVLSYKK